MGSYKSARKQFEKVLGAETRIAASATADQIIDYAKPHIPQPGSDRGYATGALKESGYIAVEGGNESAYTAAIVKAQAAPDTRIVKRNQLGEALKIEAEPQHAKAAAVWPLVYADAINSGFYHKRAGKHIIGSDFAQSAMNEADDDAVKNFRKAVDKAVKVSI